MKTLKLIVGFLVGIVILTLLMSNEANAQDQGFIYGQVTTIDGNKYEGQIRWGKEEAFWSDIFNSAKDENEYLKELEREDIDELRENRRNNQWGDNRWGWDWNWDWENEFVHQFSCQFGEIKSIEVTGRNKVNVELKNGKFVRANGEGYNDIGTKIRVMDNEIGEIHVAWTRIETVVFKDTPKKLEQKFGNPLYGVVETRGGTFKGYVQWDHDERLSTDKLDGDTRDGDISISFGKIKSIEKDGGASIVTMNSGRVMELRGSNDVNGDNRGVIVNNEEYGRVDIPWRAFEKVTFSEAKDSGKPYSAYGAPQEINGKLITNNGESLGGKIVFDLDEAYTFELLQGKIDDDIEFIIPFRNIDKIIPKNYNYAEVYLKSGKKILLGDGQDVSDKNYGVLVYSGERRPDYVKWEDIKDLRFE